MLQNTKGLITNGQSREIGNIQYTRHRLLKQKHNAICAEISWLKFMVLNVIFNNISVISWQSVLLVEETGVPGEIYLSVSSQ
jgi:hypothetical protein